MNLGASKNQGQQILTPISRALPIRTPTKRTLNLWREPFLAHGDAFQKKGLFRALSCDVHEASACVLSTTGLKRLLTDRKICIRKHIQTKVQRHRHMCVCIHIYIYIYVYL